MRQGLWHERTALYLSDHINRVLLPKALHVLPARPDVTRLCQVIGFSIARNISI